MYLFHFTFKILPERYSCCNQNLLFLAGSDGDYEDFEDEVVEEPNEVGVLQLLQQHRDDDDEEESYFGAGYDEEDY